MNFVIICGSRKRICATPPAADNEIQAMQKLISKTAKPAHMAGEPSKLCQNPSDFDF